MRRGGRRQDRALPHNHLGRTGCGGHAQNHLRRAIPEIAPIPPQNQGLALDAINGGPDGLNKVL